MANFVVDSGSILTMSYNFRGFLLLVEEGRTALLCPSKKTWEENTVAVLRRGKNNKWKLSIAIETQAGFVKYGKLFNR